MVKESITKKDEYKLLMKLEQESTKSRNTTFTAILSISFILPALALKIDSGANHSELTFMCQSVFMLGFVFFVLSLIHYEWHHRYSHIYRKRLTELEEDNLDIEVYRLRKRPVIWNIGLHYDWALYIVGLCYGLSTWYFVTFHLLWIPCGLLLAYYLLIFIVKKGEKTHN